MAAATDSVGDLTTQLADSASNSPASTTTGSPMPSDSASGEEEEVKVIFRPSDYLTEFDGAAYLENFYSPEAMAHGTRLSLFALPQFAEMLRRRMPAGDRRSLLDVGAGPTIYSAVCFRDCCQRVFLADYVEENLRMLDEWRNGSGNFDWTSVIRVIARNEATDTFPEMLERIERCTRDCVASGAVLHADVHQHQLLHYRDGRVFDTETQFDVIVSIFCLESACSTDEEYRKAMGNMLRFLRPGGAIILGTVIDQDVYDAGTTNGCRRLFTLLPLSEQFIFEVLEENDVQTDSAVRIGLDNAGATFIMAWKRSTPPE